MTKKFSIRYADVRTKQHVQTIHVQRDTANEAKAEADKIIRMYRHKLNNLSATIEQVE